MNEFDWNNKCYLKDSTKTYHKIERNNNAANSHRFEKNTEYGTAKIDSSGYYAVGAKKLHSLIYNDKYGISSNLSLQIHHIDGDKLNNDLINLIAVTPSEHGKLHHILNLSKLKLKKGVELLQIISNNSPYVYEKKGRYYYNFEYSYFWKEYNLKNEILSESAFANSLNQLEHLVIVSGLYWDSPAIH